jgi:hypothetical protein
MSNKETAVEASVPVKAERKAVVITKKVKAPGRISRNLHVGNYRCINNKTGCCVLTCNTLDGAIAAYPDYEVVNS